MHSFLNSRNKAEIKNKYYIKSLIKANKKNVGFQNYINYTAKLI